MNKTFCREVEKKSIRNKECNKIKNPNFNYYIVNFIIHSLAKKLKNMYGTGIYGKGNSYNSNKKIKNYSYNALDSIGKGFSSVVYKGVNE